MDAVGSGLRDDGLDRGDDTGVLRPDLARVFAEVFLGLMLLIVSRESRCAAAGHARIVRAMAAREINRTMAAREFIGFAMRTK